MGKRSKSSIPAIAPLEGGASSCRAISREQAVFDRILAAKVLKGGGNALIKVFQGAGFQDLVKDARGRFAKVKLVKPAASRAQS